MNQLLVMAFEFFKTGLFAIGGGLATIPFLYNIARKYPWLDIKMLPNMIAISESTPGPIGINISTYAGFLSYGVAGALVSTLSLVLPSFIVIVLISKILKKFKDNHFVDDAFFGIRPAVTALIASAGMSVLIDVIFFEGYKLNVKALILLVVLSVLRLIFKKAHPVFLIAVAAIIGAVFPIS